MAAQFLRKVSQVGFLGLLCLLTIGLVTEQARAQQDQGGITGFVKDPTGAMVPGADVTVTNLDTGLVLHAKSSSGGAYTVAPVKIGNYTVSAHAPGFGVTTETGVHVDIQQRAEVTLTLKVGGVSETVSVDTQAPLLQSQDASVQQVITAHDIDTTPLNGRNFVYIAQLTAGIAPPGGNTTRGSGTGDFVANGQRTAQNDFILDGVDNNTNLVDFLNGSSYVMRPPPDALAEFAIQTSSFSAEFGHSAGAVVNASIKSGTNKIHGDVWEYFRNTKLDAKDWDVPTIPVYHENQFGATVGLPILHDKLFYFGDIEANRISFGKTYLESVPTVKERNGDFTELLDGTINGKGGPVQLYAANSGGAATMSCNGVNNVICPSQINKVAQNILKMYPMPNTNGATLYNNFIINAPTHQNTIQWDQRLDWNISPKDQAYFRYSYLHGTTLNTPPLGPILDGTPYGGTNDTNLAENGMLSETHFFSPTLSNEFRFGYNWGSFAFLQPNANVNLAPTLGLGGIPFSRNEGGLPLGVVYGLSNWGSQGTSNESQNVYQILDNVAKTIGQHSIRAGVTFQAIRFFYRYASSSLGNYYFTGALTSAPAVNAPTGSGIADFLLDQMDTSALSTAPNVNDALWYRAGYVQDDWKVTDRLTVNVGLRYDYYQPYKENSGSQMNFIPSTLGIGTGSGTLLLPSRIQNSVVLGSKFTNLLLKDNINVAYTGNDRLTNAQSTDFAPRIGISYRVTPKMVARAGFGIFYGGLESQGGNNLGDNFPFRGQVNVVRPSCNLGNCPSSGITLESGESAALAAGLLNSVSLPGLHATDFNIQTPYTENYNVSLQYEIQPSLAATISYVGNESRHLSTYFDPQTLRALFPNGTAGQPLQPFPDLGGIGTVHYGGLSTYNSLQAKMEKRYSHGLSFLATYTWAHALDDTSSAGGLSSGTGYRNPVLIPLRMELTNSTYDVRNRFTINGNYELPFGKGRAFLNHGGWLDEVVGGWSASATWVAQTGEPFSVGSNTPGPTGGGARGLKGGDPFAPGVADPGSISKAQLPTCSLPTRTKQHWFNNCQFINPTPGTALNIPSPITDTATALRFLGGRANLVYGPGYQRTNMSLFKNFITLREQYLQFRADAFNLFNNPSLGNPNGTSVGGGATSIQGTRFMQNLTPDARFFQISAKYVF
ncbi:TonB-dependent receptor [Edaphobacter bradus]|uniref:TonB-dependent receptor n=1 Tax=Edaphobacter bradus TaxID=2259016 RepID=UPI0021E073A6|nr:carboxypeptidase regulatory-like domain-containing protein [Edaphobacter bradus]